MGTVTAIHKLPSPDFVSMSDKAIRLFLNRNRTYVSGDDLLGTREQLTSTAGKVFDRKSEDFDAAFEQAMQLDKTVSETSATLNAFPKGAMGLTPDEVKASSEFKSAQHAFDVAFRALRAFNSRYTKTFADELRHHRQATRATLLKAST